jgi:hypothetical protein
MPVGTCARIDLILLKRSVGLDFARATFGSPKKTRLLARFLYKPIDYETTL